MRSLSVILSMIGCACLSTSLLLDVYNYNRSYRNNNNDNKGE